MEYTDVLKVGTNVITGRFENGGSLRWRDTAINYLGQQAAGSNTVLVSSAAIATGMMLTDLKERPSNQEMTELQRLSGLGWRYLLNRWEDAMPVNRHVNGVLLTRQELEDGKSQQEVMNVIHRMLSRGDIPVVNENDTVSHDEISFGDNDILAAILAVTMHKSEKFGQVRMFLASDVNGICRNPKDPTTRVPVITDTSDYEDLIQESDNENGSGGVASKFMAANIVNEEGIDMWIFNGHNGVPRSLAVEGEIGTYFPAHS